MNTKSDIDCPFQMNLAIWHSKIRCLYGFIAEAERTFGAALPFSLHQVVFRPVSRLRRTDPPQILLKETRSGNQVAGKRRKHLAVAVAACPEQRGSVRNA